MWHFALIYSINITKIITFFSVLKLKHDEGMKLWGCILTSFKVARTCSSGNYTQKCIIKFCNYWFIVPATLHFSASKHQKFFQKFLVVYSEQQTKPINIICGQDAESLKLEADGITFYHCTIKELNIRIYIQPLYLKVICPFIRRCIIAVTDEAYLNKQRNNV